LPPAEKLIQAVRDCLSESALPVLAMDVLLSKLRSKGIDVTGEWCLEQIGKNQNVVALLPARDGFIVKLVV
jgi:hypothetical protein